MSDTIISQRTETGSSASPRSYTTLLAGRRGRKLRESLLAYALLLPAFIIIFTFGIFPLAFSAYESTLRGLNQIVGDYTGMGNYVRAVGDLAYVLGFWAAIVFVLLAARRLRSVRQLRERNRDNPGLLALPAVIMAFGVALFVRFFFDTLPEILGIADKMRDAQRAGEGPPGALFRRFLAETFMMPEVQSSFWLAIGVLVLALAGTIVVFRRMSDNRRQADYYQAFFEAAILFMAAAGLTWFTWQGVQDAYAAALEEGVELALWSQILTISAGIVLLGLSWLIWNGSTPEESNRRLVLRLLAMILLLTGAWILIGEVPRAAASGDDAWWAGLLNTIYYSAGSIPLQMIISLTLASFLFQNIKGKSLFRIIYFLPFITPTVGAAAVFRVLFSGRVDAPMNQLVTFLGGDALGWLNEPTGIFQMIAGTSISLPSWAAGPSLSLVVIILFGVWTFIGFNTVIFLAGLGAIPSSLYEAASIDGAGRWAQFRHVTLPLLSPTIYFLTLYAVIGTFKAFNHIYVLRTPAALRTADTVSVVIFDAMKRDTRYGYAAALAILLLIIVMLLTAVNNRVASKRVFYG